MNTLLLIVGGLAVAAALYTWLLSKTRAYYEPDNTHWAAMIGVAIVQVAYLALCLVGPVPFFGDLPLEAWSSQVLLCWIAFLFPLYWRERDKANQRAKRKAGE